MIGSALLKIRAAALLTAILCLVPFVAATQAAERITSFDSRVEVHPDGRLTVMETISVIAGGNKIKRGVYRDFPTDYTTPSGSRLRVDFTVLSVLRDGREEPWFTKRLDNGVRLYIGDKDVVLKPGPYTYVITYQTDRQIGFFTEYDELYWNVTGNGWAFPIDTASATIVLPAGASILQSAWYTGPEGSTAMNARIVEHSGNVISFRTTAPLAPKEGLTVAISWPKGFVHEPTPREKAASFFRDNIMLGGSGITLLLLFAYYLVAWFMVGRDPAPGTIIPRFHPPDDLTPAGARFIRKMGFDNKAFTAALVSMATRQALTITQDADTFTLTRTHDSQTTELSRGERNLAARLFAESDSVRLKKTNHALIRAAVKALRESLRAEFELFYFKRNRAAMIPGLLLTLVLIIFVVIRARRPEVAIFMSVWLTGWSAGCYALALSAYRAWKIALTAASGLGPKFQAIIMTLFALPFLGGLIGGFIALGTATNITSVALLIVCLSTNILFYHLLKAPTLHGRKILDELEGLRLYLSVAEKDRLNLLNPPEKTPELFEKMLPWALALDVEQQWCESFDEILTQAQQEGTYTPTWYQGAGHFSPVAMATSLGTALTGTIASSSTAPGSSSGSGGGGFSGGGGGGGGGGGW